MDSIPYRNYVYCYYPYVCLKVENHPALLTVSSMVFLSPGRQTPQKNNQTGKMHNSLIYIRAVYKNPVLSGVLVCA